ncbi:MAG: histidinol-phosphatase [Anaerolineales bacterium]|nr:histidinol-phosphatase [Anaerolineales bacterium]
MTYPLLSYHGGHSGDLCDHAHDTKAALLEAYLARGFTHVGITEHLPPPEDAFLYPSEIEKGHDAAYLQRVFDEFQFHTRPLLRQQYGDKFHLAFSFETEWYGKHPARWLEKNIEKYRPDYVIASVHHVNDIPTDMTLIEFANVVRMLGGVDEVFQAYYDRQFALFSTLAPYASQIPIVVGHFDVIKLFAPDHDPSEEVWRRMVRNLDFAIANEYVFEVNARAFKKGLGEPYPSEHLLTQICDMGGEITLGDDSHAASEVGLHFEDALPVVRSIFNEVVAFEWGDQGCGEGGRLEKVYLPL